ncbi:MAG: hypothetical protein GKC53_01510 [Neisseriaceae bacterium]|nr:MAG: hypothetical protein GKC53_01510 [Neisseriaceae bacterium]
MKKIFGLSLLLLLFPLVGCSDKNKTSTSPAIEENAAVHNSTIDNDSKDLDNQIDQALEEASDTVKEDSSQAKLKAETVINNEDTQRPDASVESVITEDVKEATKNSSKDVTTSLKEDAKNLKEEVEADAEKAKQDIEASTQKVKENIDKAIQQAKDFIDNEKNTQTNLEKSTQQIDEDVKH